MKTFVILVVLFAYTQATSVPVTVEQVAINALTTCIQEKSLDANKIKGIMKHDILPEDDAEFTDFFACYWKNAKVIKDDGTFDDLYIKVSYPHLIKAKYPSLTDAVTQDLASNAVDHCKGTPKGDSVGLKGIQYRNCMTQFVIDSKA